MLLFSILCVLSNTKRQIADSEHRQFELQLACWLSLDSQFKCDTELLSEGLDRRLEAEALAWC